MTPHQSSSLPALRIAVIGMGGFASAHHDAVMQLEQQNQCQLVCACDPLPDSFSNQCENWQFKRRGVKIYDDYRAMLNAHASELDLVTIPTPVPLHAEMHQLAVALGIPVYLEKPPTLDFAELDKMLSVEQLARRDTNVGFNFIIEQPRQNLKRRLVAGEFGKLLKVGFTGLWPRTRAYYQRASWAGRLMLNNHIVLDSPLGNALAHYAHNVLYWAGTDELHHWADIAWVQAELYRAHEIQGTDTIFLQAKTTQDVTLEIALTHACEGESRHREWLVCENATVVYTTYRSYEIRWNDGRNEHGIVNETTLADNIAAHLAFLRRDPEYPRPATRLADCKPFVILNDLTYISSDSISRISAPYVSVKPEFGSETVAINNIESIINVFTSSGSFPSQQGIAWAHAGRTAHVADIENLHQVINKMSYKAL